MRFFLYLLLFSSFIVHQQKMSCTKKKFIILQESATHPCLEHQQSFIVHQQKNVMHKEKVHNFTRICYTPVPRAPTVDIATQSSRHSFKQVVVQTNCTQKFYTMLTKHSIKRIGDNIHIAANHFKTTVIAGRSHTNSPASL